MELPGFHEELSKLVKKYAFLAANSEQTLRELERFVCKVKARWRAKDINWQEGFRWTSRLQEESVFDP